MKLKEFRIPGLILLAALTFSCGDMYSEMAENARNLNVDAPAVTSIAPVNGEPDTIVSLEITGTGFQAGAAATLKRSGLEIPADGEIVSGGTKISCSIDLAGAALGKWSVVVTNPDGVSGELANAFEVSLTHSVIYDANGGITPPGDPNMYFSGDTVTVLGQGSTARAGYDFAGWYDSGSGTVYNEGDTFIMPVTDVTLTAQWTAKEYTVTFDAEGGDAPAPLSTTVTFDSPYGSLATTGRNGYAFTGWWTGAGGTEITAADIVSVPAEHTLYAGWNAISYTITYDLDGGSDPGNPASYTIETPTINLLPATKTGYAFNGWFDGAMMATEIPMGSTGDISLVAMWTAEDYDLTFHANGGSGFMAAQTFTFNTTGSLDPNTFTPPAGYSFAGWAATPAGAVAYGDGASYTMSTEGADLYAKWTANTYEVTFDWDDGLSTTSTGSVTFGAPYGALPTPTRTGYTFGGWYTVDNGTGDLVTAATTVSTASDHTLHAKWTANNYNVIFNTNGGSGSMGNQAIAYGLSANLAFNTFTRMGHTFSGWATSPASAVAYGDGASYTMNTTGATLYAKWSVNNYNVIFNANGGSGSMGNQTIAYGSSANLTANAFTREDCDFAGWSTTESGSVSYADGASYTMNTANNVDLYAQWTMQAGYQEELTADGVSFIMVYVPGKTIPDEHNGTTKTVKTVWISETEVTYELWSAVYAWAVTDAGGGVREDGGALYYFQNPGQIGSGGSGSDQQPVTGINSRDAMIFYNALTEWYNRKNGAGLTCAYYKDSACTDVHRDSRHVQDGVDYSASINSNDGGFDRPYIKGCGGTSFSSSCTATGFRHPGIYEWHLAARWRNTYSPNTVAGYSNPWFITTNSASGAAVSLTDYSDGSGEPAKSANDAVAVYGYYYNDSSWISTGVTGTAAVKSKAPNDLGIYDMSGNACECALYYSSRCKTGGYWQNYASSMAMGVNGISSNYNTDNYMGIRLAMYK